LVAEYLSFYEVSAREENSLIAWIPKAASMKKMLALFLDKWHRLLIICMG
jgi:hypothetical protein